MSCDEMRAVSNRYTTGNRSREFTCDQANKQQIARVVG